MHAIVIHGSIGAARQALRTENSSEHATGRAVDVEGTNADNGWSAKAAPFGLCRGYANEPQLFNMAADAADNCLPLLRLAPGGP